MWLLKMKRVAAVGRLQFTGQCCYECYDNSVSLRIHSFAEPTCHQIARLILVYLVVIDARSTVLPTTKARFRAETVTRHGATRFAPQDLRY